MCCVTRFGKLKTAAAEGQRLPGDALYPGRWQEAGTEEKLTS